MKTLFFEKEPTHSELWDACAKQLLYCDDTGEIPYYDGMATLMQSRGVKSILDVCAGSGFPSLFLRSQGFVVDCMDASNEARLAFMENARQIGVDETIALGRLEDVYSLFAPNQYDSILCKGSIWYTENGYTVDGEEGEMQKKTKTDTLARTTHSLSCFRDLLRDDGFLYVDKYRDDETSHIEQVAKIQYGSEQADLYFKVEYQGEFRNASMRIVNSRGVITENNCYAHHVSSNDLETCLENAGFLPKKETIVGENYFDVWIANM